METKFNINITPNLYDPEGEPIMFLKELGERIAYKYQTEVNASVQAETMRVLRFDLYLVNQRVGAWGNYHVKYISEALKNEDGLDNPIHVFSTLFDDIIRKAA